MIVLDMGCGPRKTPGAVGVDKAPFRGVDVIWDLESYPYPFKDDTADRVIFNHILEHLDDPLKALREAARILRPGGRILIRTPHFSSVNAYSDLTHRHAFSLLAFRSLTIDNDEVSLSPDVSYASAQARAGGARQTTFRLAAGNLTFMPLHARVLPFVVPAQWLGAAWLSRRFPNFYERFLAFLFPADEIQVQLEVMKQGGAS